MCVNNLPKVAIQWNSGATRDSNRGRRVLIPSALTTRPPIHTIQLSSSRLFFMLLQIIKERVERLRSRSMFQWNMAPGALAVLPEFSQHDADFPFYWRHQRPLLTGFSTTTACPLVNGSDSTGHLVTADVHVMPAAWFTAVVYVNTATGSVTSGSRVYRLLKTIGRSCHLRKVSRCVNYLSQVNRLRV